MRIMITSCLLVALLGAGCTKDTKAPPSAEQKASTASPSAAAVHAPAGVKPGSHDDWCGEHAVPESQCTRCNPELSAAFKATNDWCAEHGLPESQCLKCNPDLKITRPPKEGS